MATPESQKPTAGHYRMLKEKLEEIEKHATTMMINQDETGEASEEERAKLLKEWLTEFGKGSPEDDMAVAEYRPIVEAIGDLDYVVPQLQDLLDARIAGATRGGTRKIRRSAYSRKGYTRRSGTKVRGSRVPARMIRDVGAPGKWRAEHMGAPGIGKLKQGELTSVGYSSSAKVSTRRKAVDRAVKKYGKLSTLRKLNAVAVYTRRTSPMKSKAFKSDVRYVQKKYY